MPWSKQEAEALRQDFVRLREKALDFVEKTQSIPEVLNEENSQEAATAGINLMVECSLIQQNNPMLLEAVELLAKIDMLTNIIDRNDPRRN